MFLRTRALGDDRAAAQAWRVAMAALLAARYLEHPVDLQRVLEMALAGALPAPSEALRDALDPDNGVHLHALMLERGNGGTSEARLIEALAALVEGCAVAPRDRFLRSLADAMVPPDARAAG